MLHPAGELTRGAIAKRRQPGALQQLTGIYVNLLPENDVLRIRRGIRVHSLPELQALLEDLGG